MAAAPWSRPLEEPFRHGVDLGDPGAGDGVDARLHLRERTEGLAPLLVREVGRVIDRLKGEGLSILLVEQNLPLALRVADHVHVVSRGQIVHSSPPAALAANDEIKARYLGL